MPNSLNAAYLYLNIVAKTHKYILPVLAMGMALATMLPCQMAFSSVEFAPKFIGAVRTPTGTGVSDDGVWWVEQKDGTNRTSTVNFGRNGGTALRLHTEPGDSYISGSLSSERNDLALPLNTTDGFEGRVQWWAHSILFPSDFVIPPPGHWATVFDFHDSKNQGGQANFHIFIGSNGQLMMRGHGGPDLVYDAAAGNQYSYGAAVGPLVKNTWYDFVYHVKWSSGSDGFIEAWVNGKKVLTHYGPTLYAGYGVYLKLANYHSAFGQASSVIHDRLIRGTTFNDVAIGALEGINASDTSAPSLPANLAASVVSSSQINLRWNAASDNVGVTGYNLYLNDAFLVRLSGTTSYSHTGLAAGATYRYRVSSFDAAGNNSGWTPTPLTVTTSTRSVASTPVVTTSVTVTNTMTNTATNITLKMTYSGAAPSFLRFFLDTNQNSSSGFQTNGIGADYLIENGVLYRYSGGGGAWGWTRVKSLSYTNSGGIATCTVLSSDLGGTFTVRVLGQMDPGGNSAIVTQNLPGVALSTSSTATNSTYQVTYAGTPTFTRVFLDTDRSAGTGYVSNGIGANFLIENGTLYRYSGSGGGWGWTLIRRITPTISTGRTIYTILRSDIGTSKAITAFAQIESPRANSSLNYQSLPE